MTTDSISFKYLGSKGRTFLPYYFFHLCNLIFLLFVLELRSLVFGRLEACWQCLFYLVYRGQRETDGCAVLKENKHISSCIRSPEDEQ